MAKTLTVLVAMALTFQAQGTPGQKACTDKHQALQQLCVQQTLKKGVVHFSSCSNGFSYTLAAEVPEADFTLTSGEASCKITEIRNEKSIAKKTTYFNQQAQRVVVYKHTNGLSNTFVYGHTGYYHVSEVETGDSLYNFHSYNN